MKKIYYPLHALLCVMFCISVTQAQQKFWFTVPGSYVPPANAAYHVNLDGTDLVKATTFEPLGGKSEAIFQASNGEIFGTTYGGGANGFGTLFKIGGNGIVKLHDLNYGESAMELTEGNDGFIYGAGSDGIGSCILRFRPDGTGYERKHIFTYGFGQAPILATSTGEIFGTAHIGGANGNGYIYKFKPGLAGIEIVYSFDRFATGAYPKGGLIEGADGFLYGATRNGGAKNYGVIYKVRPSGQDFQVLYQFDNISGRYPNRGLVQDASGNLYGTTHGGGTFKKGLIFKIASDGTGFTRLHEFQNSIYISESYEEPLLLSSDSYLYGRAVETTNQVIRIKTDGSDYGTVFTGPSTGIHDLRFLKPIQPSVKLASPANNATVHYYVSGYVQAVPGALTYLVELATAPDFSGPVLRTASAYPDAPEFIPFPWKKVGTTYYARAKSSLWPEFGPVISFKTYGVERYMIVTKPTNGSTGHAAINLKVTANEVRTGNDFGGAVTAKRYTIELNTSADFTGASIVKSSAIDYQRTLIFPELEYNTTYYTRVKTELFPGWGNVTSFTTMPEPMSEGIAGRVVTTGQDELQQETNFAVDVRPNPFQSHVIVTARSTEYEKVRIVVTDISGRLVYEGHASPGQELQLGDELASGFYILRATNSRQSATHRLLKN
ncbi:MAG: choice-of-anchor tandem repeat GloVer-containing protein [Bacteroidota bacterium]